MTQLKSLLETSVKWAEQCTARVLLGRKQVDLGLHLLLCNPALNKI